MRPRTGSNGGGSAVCQPRTEAHKPASMRKQPLRMTMGPERMTLDLVHLHLSKCKGLPYCSSGTKKAVYYTKDLFDFVLTCFSFSLFFFCFVFQFLCKKSISCVTSFEIIRKRYPIINYLRNVVTSLI